MLHNSPIDHYELQLLSEIFSDVTYILWNMRKIIFHEVSLLHPFCVHSFSFSRSHHSHFLSRQCDRFTLQCRHMALGTHTSLRNASIAKGHGKIQKHIHALTVIYCPWIENVSQCWLNKVCCSCLLRAAHKVKAQNCRLLWRHRSVLELGNLQLLWREYRCQPTVNKVAS